MCPLEAMLQYLLFFLIAGSTASALNNDNGRYDLSAKNCTTLECVLIDNLILNDINKYGDPCGDTSSYLCSKDTFSFGKKAGLFSKPELNNLITPILDGSAQHEFSGNKLKSLKIEQELFKACMKFVGNNSFESTMEEFDRLRPKNKSSDSWQDIHEEFNSLGFGYTFFDIDIIRNPRYPETNIITLQPSKHKFTQILPKIIQDAFQIIEIAQELDTKVVNHTLPNQYLNIIPNKNVIQFLMSLLQITLDTSNNTKTYISIEKWNQTYNYHYANYSTAQIDWPYIFSQSFRQVDINIDKAEVIFINQVNYFIKLAEMLSTTPNEVIAEAIIFIWRFQIPRYRKFVSSEAGNLQVADYLRYQCSTETQLYATSYVILHFWESDEHVKQRRYLLEKITKAIKNEISQSASLHENAKLYYSKKLNAITSNIIKGDWNQSFISDYYGDFKLTENYYTNILSYKKLIRNKRLKNLRNSPEITMESAPFSVNEPFDIRNDLITWLYTFGYKRDDVLVNQLMNLSKELLFSTHGVKLAEFLYISMTNDLLNHVLSYGPVPLITYPENNIFRCFSRETSDRKMSMTDDLFLYIINNRTEKYYYKIDDIVDSFAIRVAYNAMHDENCDSTSESMCNTITNELGITSEKLFFLAYIKSNCNRSQQFAKVDNTLKDLEEYSRVFQCPMNSKMSKNHKKQICNLNLFDINDEIFSHA